MERWSSRYMFLLAAIGSAVGLGNIWRFPYMAGAYGGGSFIVIYLLSVALIGLPLMILEFTAGKYFAYPLSPAFSKIGRNVSPISLVLHALNLLILSYYVVVTGWTLAYLFSSVSGAYAPLAEYSKSIMFPFSTALTLLAIFLIMRMDLRQGIERANSVLMPVFFAILLALLIYSFTLPGLGQALKFYTDFGSVNLETAMAAIAQTLFSLSVGAGIMFTYASHAEKKEKTASAAAIVSFTDTAVALIAGIAIFPIVFTYGLNPSEGATLAFDTLPLAFLQMPFGNIAMPMFFLLLFSVALTSTISMAEVGVVDLSVRTGRKRAALYLTALVALLSIPSLLSYSSVDLKFAGVPVLDYLDGTVVVLAFPVVALLLVLALGWVWKDFEEESAKALPKLLLKPYVLLIRFFIPAALLALSLAGFLARI
ncbi:MAG: sodium-dependent transporter [Candidatus ainarchaeum sp.]|nr:sodium-dependent transporter [Candidatus ainarchaeum sp.]